MQRGNNEDNATWQAGGRYELPYDIDIDIEEGEMEDGQGQVRRASGGEEEAPSHPAGRRTKPREEDDDI